MFANKSILLSFLVWGLVAASCAPESTPTSQFGPTVTPIQQETTAIVTTEIPVSVIQPDNESKEEFIVRIAATKIISERPFLIALSQIGKENFWFGVSRDMKDIEKCWIYGVDSILQCTSEDLRNNLGNQKIPKIFFAFAYSDSLEELFILDYRYPPVDQDMVEEDMLDTIDGYRLVIELQNGKWVEKSLIQVY